MAEPPKGYAPGGLLHGHRVTYSQDTKNLLNNMMAEARLTNLQRKELSRTIEDGKALPKPVQKSSSVHRSQNSSKTKYTASGKKVLNPRNYSSGIRNKNQIEASGAYERERFYPAPLTKYGGQYDKDKDRLCNIMTYGDEEGLAGSLNHRAESPPPSLEERAPPVDRFTEIQNEISERKQFLEEMHSLGCGAKYQSMIETEISQLVREMEIIDRRENEELERRIKEQERRQKLKTATK